MKNEIIRLFVRSVRWITIIHNGSEGKIALKIGLISGDIIKSTFPTIKLVESIKKLVMPYTNSDILASLLSNLDNEELGPDLITALQGIAADSGNDNGVYLHNDDPGRVIVPFREKAELLAQGILK